MPTFAKQKFIVISLAAVYFICLSFFSILNHRGLRTQMNDLGNADQAIWQASGGHLSMPVSNDEFSVPVSRFYRHANFIFWFIAPLYWCWPNPEILLVLTSLACALTGLGLFAIAHQRFKNSWWSLAFPVIFWLSPMVHDANLFDFHTVTIVSALLVWMIWAFDTNRNKTGWCLLFFALLCQEDVSLMIFMYGIYLIFSGRRKLAVAIMLVSLLYPVILLKILIPFFNHGGGMYMYGSQDRYRWLGENTNNIFSYAGEILNHLTRPDRLRIPLYFLVSGALAGLDAWPILLMLLPPMLEGMLTTYTKSFESRITGSYYWICPEVFILLSCIFSSEHYLKNSSVKCPWPIIYLFLITLLLSILLTPLPYGLFADWKNYALPNQRGTLEEMVRLIPPSAPVLVQNNLGAHLAHRSMIAVYPWHKTDANFALFYSRYVSGVETDLTTKTCGFLCDPPPPMMVKKLLDWRDWGLIAYKDGFYLFGRGFPYRNDQEILKAINADSSIFDHDKNAGSHFYPWVRYLDGVLGWDQLLKNQ